MANANAPVEQTPAPMKHSDKIVALKAAIAAPSTNRTDKAAFTQELRRLEFLRTPDAEYVAPAATNYESKRVTPLTNESQCADANRFSTSKAPSKKVICEFMAPTESSPEGWVSAPGVSGRILTPKQFAKILGRTPKVGDEVVVTAYLIKKGQWYPSAPGSDSYAQEALVEHWLVPSEARTRNAETVEQELAANRALAQATAIVESGVDLVKLAQASAIAANLAKAASFSATTNVAVVDAEI